MRRRLISSLEGAAIARQFGLKAAEVVTGIAEMRVDLAFG